MGLIKVITDFLGGNKLSEEEVRHKTIDCLNYLRRIRSPEAPGTTEKVWEFKIKYLQEHPEASRLEAHDTCMKAHSEYWPRTLP